MSKHENDWEELSRRAAFASHRLIGWIYWDPRAIANYEALGIPNGFGYYVSTRAATLGKAAATALFPPFPNVAARVDTS